MLPTIILGLYGTVAAGYYGLIVRVIAAPLELIGRGFTEAFLGEASTLVRSDIMGLKGLMVRSAGWLFLLGFAQGVVMLFFGPSLFYFVFGAEWYEAGLLARCMAVMVPFSYVNYPLVHILNVLQKPQWQSCWDCLTVLVGPGGVIVAYLSDATYMEALTYYAISMSIMFSLHLGVSFWAVNQRVRTGVRI
jgi:O-antigen/teichoic acid export membrane protein